MSEYLFPLKDRHEVAEGTMEFWFDTSGTDFSFKAGQNADFTLIDPPETDAEGNTRTFSFATSPNTKGAFAVATRMRDTAFKRSLAKIPLGTKVKVAGPMGAFTLHKDAAKPAVFVAGGIGVTPARSIILWAHEEKLPHEIYLFYSNRTPRSAAYLDDFEKVLRGNPRFHLIPTVTEANNPMWRYGFGRIDAALLRKSLLDVKAPVYYVAGPPAMVEAMRKVLAEVGANEDNIKSEEFAGY